VGFAVEALKTHLEDLLGLGTLKPAILIGAGRLGQALTAYRGFTEYGLRICGIFDIDPEKIEALAAGRPYIKHIGEDKVRALKDSPRFTGTTDFSRCREADVLIICVPTPLGRHREPDLSFVENTAREVAKTLRAGQLIVLESTTYPGTTEELVLPILEATGLKCGRDFWLAFSPEREDPGNAKFSTTTIPKVVGGTDERTTRMACALYGSAIGRTVPVSSPRVAEMAKLLENIFRSVNIALVNELKVVCERMNIDIWEVIEAASTKPFGFMPFYPGPGLGGHCIPIDPFYLTWKAAEYGLHTKFIELAGEINTAMPHYVVGKLVDALNRRGRSIKGARVLLLGVAYKKNIDDLRESPSLELMELLLEHDVRVVYNDPYIPKLPRMRKHRLQYESQPLTPELLRSVDVVLVATDHDCYDYEMIVREAPLVVDSRNATRKVTTNREKIVKA